MQRQFLVHEVKIGTVVIGAGQPVVIQTMTNSKTTDIESTFNQCVAIVEAGAQLIRISAKDKSELKSIQQIKEILKKRGLDVPIIADIHFSSSLAVEAASVVEKVRINPGNFIKNDFNLSNEEYFEEIQKRLQPLIDSCNQNHAAIRVGTNHGSLSERIKMRFGTGPQAMAEASMELVRIIAATGFQDVVLSVKASNTLENIHATRLLAQMQNKEGFSFPFHIGVTEAGLGFSGRIKSAAGIGALLADGIGDTIRVSLTESPVSEIPVAIALAQLFNPQEEHFLQLKEFEQLAGFNKSNNQNFVIFGSKKTAWQHGLEPDVFTEDAKAHNYHVIETKGLSSLYDFRQKFIEAHAQLPEKQVIWKRTADIDELFELRFAAELGNLISFKVLSGCIIEGDECASVKAMAVLYEVLQACDIRKSHVEFISCPSCNRTSYDILQLAEEVRSKTWHMSGLKIAVMGCIVNGPGEMGNADYGLVGHGNGLLALYKKGVMIEKNIPKTEACRRLIEEIIKESL